MSEFDHTKKTILNYDNFFLPVDDLEKAHYFYEHFLELAVKFNFSE